VQGERVVVVGGGDAAIENAMALSRHNTVTVVTRGAGFPRAKEGNATRIARAIAAGQIECLLEAQPTRVEESLPGADTPYLLHATVGDSARTIPCHRVSAAGHVWTRGSPGTPLTQGNSCRVVLKRYGSANSV
jgi:thioredoxin reductase